LSAKIHHCSSGDLEDSASRRVDERRHRGPELLDRDAMMEIEAETVLPALVGGRRA